MELKDIIAISGIPGLHEVVAKRDDGMIVRSLEEDKPKFVSSRVHVFTPLDSITIYTDKDNAELGKVLPEMKKQEKENPPVESSGTNEEHKAYFRKILPDFDEERVYVSDIKKLIKWYNLLNKFNLLPEEEKEEKKKETKTEKKKAATDKKEAKETERAASSAKEPKKKKKTKTE